MHLQVYGEKQVLRIKYDTPYVRNLTITLTIPRPVRQVGVIERSEHPAWGDAFVEEWRAFYTNIITQQTPKTSAADFRHDLELFAEMIGCMQK